MSDADAGRMPPPAEDRAAGDTTATIARLERRALREREARRQAEALLETRSLELYEANQALTRLAGSLEEQVEARTREMESAVLRANEALSAKTNFLATMSHELRTPMNGVIGAVQLLLDSPLAPEQQAHAETIRASGELLLSIINDILDLSKIDAGRLVLESRPFDPRRSLASIDSLMRPTAGARGIDFDVRVDPAVPTRLVGDDMRLRQVMLNLASNAVKFTSQGGVAVRLAAGPPDAEGWLPVEFTVEDTGIGIPSHRLETVFEPFTQADASTAREYGGTGLGLAICRRIAGLMHGSLEVESIPGQGSVFRMCWRAQAAVAQAADAEPAPASMPASPGDTRSLRVLVVEDNEINRTIACALLARLGLDAEVAEDGEVALEKVVCGRYDLVLMDMRMPRMDGLESTRRMRALPLGRQPRVFALTANAFEEDRQACLAAGMDGFLSKPYRLEQLAGVVADVRAWLRMLDPA
ncbi:MAG: response regulator [Burkholderiales bacterium]|nr:response regulator [Burkholderiales bacterium]